MASSSASSTNGLNSGADIASRSKALSLARGNPSSLGEGAASAKCRYSRGRRIARISRGTMISDRRCPASGGRRPLSRGVALLARHDLVVDGRSVLAIERADMNVEARRNAVRRQVGASSSPTCKSTTPARSTKTSTADAARPKTTSNPGRRIWPPTARPAPRRRPISSGSSATRAPIG
jgi:hypothetical protein